MLSRLMTVGEVAAALNCALPTVFYLTSKRRIEHIRIGRALRFRPEAVEAYRQANTIKQAE